MACPDDQELLAMLERSMNPTLFGELEQHIDSCASCRKAVAALAKGSLPQHAVAPFEELDHELAPGATIDDRYVVSRELGRGGMGTVYLAHDPTLGRDVAIKLHRAGSSADRLQREAVAMAKLAHPNVVNVFEVATVDDRIYVAMEYVRGTTLRGWIAQSPRSWREIVAMITACGRGLAAAHAAGLVHRDFKPENVLVGDDGRPRVGDFGLARADHAAMVADFAMLTTADTMTAGVAGTPAYMAPEQMNGDPVDARSDQFAFCIAAWESLYGKRPFAGTTLALLHAAIEAHELVVPKATPAVPDRVHAVIARGLAHSPSDRFPDMTALLTALDRAARPRHIRNTAAVVVGLAVLGGGSALAAHAVSDQRHAATCDAAAAQMRDKFSLVDHTRLASAMVATGVPYAQSSIDHAIPVLDRTAAFLADQAISVCQDATLTPHARDVRTTCLASRGAGFASVVDQLEHGDATVVRNAPDSAWALYDPTPCSEGPIGAPPMSLALAKRIGDLHALIASQRVKDAIATGTALLADARAQHDTAAETQIALSLAGVQDEVEPGSGVASFNAAEAAAETQGRDLEAASALAGLAADAGTGPVPNFAQAHHDLELAHAKLTRVGGNTALEAKLAQIEAEVLVYENRFGDAERAMRKSLDLAEKLFGADHPIVGGAYGTLSQIVDAEGKHAEQLADAQKAFDILRAAYGDVHPQVATATGNLSVAYRANDRLDDARRELLAADRMYEQLYGPNHPAHAITAANLGSIEMRAGNWAAARTAMERSKAIWSKVAGPMSPPVAGIDRDLGDTLQMLGDHDGAIASDREAVTIYEQLGADGTVRLGPALDDLCEQLLVVKRYADCRPMAERALAMLEAKPADANPQELADARLMVAKVLWETHGDHAKARALARSAVATGVEPDRKQLATDWLAAHR
ncbi:MAG TPA: serine/threonine-protein kinase [Kofleriaceae bacterium]|nr:serine/threonine-protein kinase [Kofleriaceae bacterium]